MDSINIIAALLFYNSQKNPNKDAFVYNGESITYKDFATLVKRTANKLKTLNISSNSLFGTNVTNSINFCALLFSSSLLGAAVMPFDKTTPINSLNKTLSRLEVKTLISDDFFNDIHGYSEEFDYILETSLLSGDEPMVISMTSGSTKDPKPLVLSQKTKLLRAKTHIELFNLKEDDVILASTPLYHSLAERLVIMSAILGSTCVIIDKFNTYEWFSLVSKRNVTFTITDSSQLVQISQLLLSPFVPNIDSLKTIVSSSSHLELHAKKEIINKLKCDFYEIYGTSETSTLTCINLKEKDIDINSVGKALKCAEIKITDKDENDIGSIKCKTDLMFNGYYPLNKDNELIKDNYFDTGDLGRIDDNGYLYYCGRKSELIKVNGINIYPIDIENTALDLEEIKECAAFLYHDQLNEPSIGLAVTLNKDISKETILEHLNSNLSKTSVPKYIYILDNLPKNEMGKIVKGKIYEYIMKQNMVGEYHHE